MRVLFLPGLGTRIIEFTIYGATEYDFENLSP